MSIALAYKGLPDIKAVHHKSKNDDILFRELEEVLERHKALDRFGIVLLHTHFDIAEDEILFETINSEERTQETKPVKLSEVKNINKTETIWRLGQDGRVMAKCVCPTYSDGSHQGTHLTPP